MVKLELEKIFKFKSLIFISIFFIILNIISISEYKYDRKLAKSFINIIESYKDINYDKALEEMAIKRDKLEKEIKEEKKDNLLDENKVMEFINLEQIINHNNIIDKDLLFNNDSARKIADKEIKIYQIDNEKTLDLIYKKYYNYQDRLNNYNSKEYKHFFYPGSYYKVQSKISKVFRYVFLQTMIIGLIINIYLINIDISTNVSLLVNTSYNKEKVVDTKVISSIIVSLFLGFIILIISLTYFFSIYSFKNFLFIPFSNIYNIEFDTVLGMISFISWNNINIITYIILITLIGFINVSIMILFFASISYLIKDIWANLFINIFIVIILYLITNIVNTISPLVFLFTSSAIFKIRSIGRLLTDGGVLTLFKYDSSISIIINLFITYFIFILSKKRYVKEDKN